ncbi:MAG: hypothetical protein IKM31_09530 [Oscillospiraceae bacterium]|nr:hypothetical protein [Oscillospiraceae bacterium]
MTEVPGSDYSHIIHLPFDVGFIVAHRLGKCKNIPALLVCRKNASIPSPEKGALRQQESRPSKPYLKKEHSR